MEGFLEKKSPILIKGYQKRYFLISQSYLMYFKTKVELPPFQPKGVIPMNSIVKVDQMDANKNEFLIQVANRQFTLRAENKDVKEQWLDILRNRDFNQEQPKGKFSKVKWNTLDAGVRIAVFLEREQVLKAKLDAIIGPKNDQVLQAKRINEIAARFADKVTDFIIYANIQKQSRKTIGVKKTRWIVMFTSINLTNGNPIGDMASYVPQTYQLDTIYMFKSEGQNDRTMYTKLQIKPAEIIGLKLNITTEFTISFTYGQNDYQYYFSNVTEAKQWAHAIESLIENEKKGSQEPKKEKQQAKYFAFDQKRVHGQYSKTKTIIEGQLEKKINQMQWKNAVVTLKEDCIFWIYVDSAELEFLEIYKISSIEKSNRSFTIFAKQGLILYFKSASLKDTQEWYEKVMMTAQIEPKVEVQSQPIRDSYKKGSSLQKQSTIIKTPPKITKPGFFQSLFCLGGERIDDNN